MPNKEATARIKINQLLAAAGWRFFPNGTAPASINPLYGVVCYQMALQRRHGMIRSSADWTSLRIRSVQHANATPS